MSKQPASVDTRNDVLRLAFGVERLLDHNQFILDKLVVDLLPGEERNLGFEVQQRAIELKDELITALSKILSNDYDPKKIINLILDVITLKEELLSFKLIPDKIKLNLPPTFINHMINEAEEFLRTAERKPHTIKDMKFHKLWSVDAEGHAEAVHDNLDPIDFRKKLVKKHIKDLRMLAKKAIELTTYQKRVALPKDLREKFIEEAVLLINDFAEFLEVFTDKPPLGTVELALIDHMIREESYYLWEVGYDVKPKNFIRALENQ